ncbi:MAG: exonuclease domain-containing protein [Roseburia sp.]|nr:exonuclease domain-containing protein [Roseburia sp.]MCM1096587.1 exonuclease domain-containing protein [Ruminococcus flavefaciens]
MNYIVLDLEWNQSNTRQQSREAGLLFEIVEIGAVKVDDRGVMIGEFSRLIKPEVYHEMHLITSRLIHLQMQELERGKPFPQVAEEFLSWCGTGEYLFCTWGNLDLTELQRNMEYYNMTPLSEGPLPFLDVQKLFSIAYEDGKLRRALEYAVDELAIEKDIPFHRAFSDAYYTAKILKGILEKHPEVMKKISYDIFHPPVSREQEIRVRFDNYEKYISRLFDNKAEVFGDREVSSSRCFVCRRNLRKKLRWFTPNGRNYYCLAHCEKHGYLKGKIRIRRTDAGKLYVVKTTKLITEKEAQELTERRTRAAEARKRHETR